MSAVAMTERQLQDAIFDLNRKLPERDRWRCYHTYDSRRSTAGFPDLVMVRDGRLIFAELKADGKSPVVAQLDWLADLDETGAETFVWRPADWHAGEIERVLR